MILLKLLKEDFPRYSKKKFSFFNLCFLALSKPGFRAITLYRIGNYFKKKGMHFMASICQRIMHHACHCYISVTAEIGSGFLIAHVGGIVIGGKTKIGQNCDVRQNVTMGGNFNRKDDKGRTQPQLGNGISIGAGACILGPVVIGNNVIIGANSVVTRDVDANMIASGIPAKPIKERWDKNSERKL